MFINLRPLTKEEVGEYKVRKASKLFRKMVKENWKDFYCVVNNYYGGVFNTEEIMRIGGFGKDFKHLRLYKGDRRCTHFVVDKGDILGVSLSEIDYFIDSIYGNNYEYFMQFMKSREDSKC